MGWLSGQRITHTDHDLLDHNGVLHHPQLGENDSVYIVYSKGMSLKLTLSVCAPGAMAHEVGTNTALFATNPSLPPHAAGCVPGAEAGMKATV